MSNFQRCFPAARGRPNLLARGKGGREMPYYIPPPTWTTPDFFFLYKKSASLTQDQGLIYLFQKKLFREKTYHNRKDGDTLENAFERL